MSARSTLSGAYAGPGCGERQRRHGAVVDAAARLPRVKRAFAGAKCEGSTILVRSESNKVSTPATSRDNGADPLSGRSKQAALSLGSQSTNSWRTTRTQRSWPPGSSSLWRLPIPNPSGCVPRPIVRCAQSLRRALSPCVPQLRGPGSGFPWLYRLRAAHCSASWWPWPWSCACLNPTGSRVDRVGRGYYFCNYRLVGIDPAPALRVGFAALVMLDRQPGDAIWIPRQLLRMHLATGPIPGAKQCRVSLNPDEVAMPVSSALFMRMWALSMTGKRLHSHGSLWSDGRRVHPRRSPAAHSRPLNCRAVMKI